jgi:hypothetical protein
MVCVFFTVRRTGMPVASANAKGEWSVLTVESPSVKNTFDMIERRGGYVSLPAGTYRVRTWTAPKLTLYTPPWFLKKHRNNNAIQPLVNINEFDLTDMFSEDPNSNKPYEKLLVLGPSSDKQQGEILIHGVGGVGGLEGCLSPGIKTPAGTFSMSWETMDTLMTIVEKDLVILRVLNNAILK